MNGGVESDVHTLEIRLKRGPSGLGFNIVGGTDQQYVSDDTGIYVSKIRDNGAAALDGRLQEGDKILAINGQKLENLSHSDAVQLFHCAGEDVVLSVLQQPSNQTNGPLRPRGSLEPGVSFFGVIMCSAMLAFVAFLYMRHRHRRGIL
ncbi:synaptojanin-2-binding protein [Erpetoichthys calabaricus]|uniref:Synaptojanin-2-binding protein n=1 Tax=Erpetoichthys calabaricus TaxID=27687 RepID=A0A8C4T3E9_ERPCA|nr:synaptojanin-2-binding protein [Erpetoichthys calabaricus]